MSLRALTSKFDLCTPNKTSSRNIWGKDLRLSRQSDTQTKVPNHRKLGEIPKKQPRALTSRTELIFVAISLKIAPNFFLNYPIQKCVFIDPKLLSVPALSINYPIEYRLSSNFN